jgi:HK97 family phage prohead protease
MSDVSTGGVTPTSSPDPIDEAAQRASAPRENLRRSVEFRAEPSNDGLTLEGYAAVFNDWTEINDRSGTYMERIAPGAFKRSIGRSVPVLQFDHGHHPLIGSIPLGRITSITEDSHGLRIKARLSDNWLVEPVRDAIRDGAISGMSFRFSIPEGGDKWEQRDGVDYRTIINVSLVEAGPVVWPAYSSTSVGVRSRQTALALTDPEVRREVAALLTLGPDDIRNIADESPAVDGALASSPAPSVDALADGPAETTTTPTRSADRRALVALAFADILPKEAE